MYVLKFHKYKTNLKKTQHKIRPTNNILIYLIILNNTENFLELTFNLTNKTVIRKVISNTNAE